MRAKKAMERNGLAAAAAAAVGGGVAMRMKQAAEPRPLLIGVPTMMILLTSHLRALPLLPMR
jgi:uncharacterized metal-binding protein